MAVKLSRRTYGKIFFDANENKWLIDKADPHVCIKLKAVFPKIPISKIQPFVFNDTPEICYDLLWFMERYPLAISDNDLNKLKREKRKQIENINELESILLPDYIPRDVKLKYGSGRNYQLTGKDLYMKCKRLLIGDDTGLGKTLIAILSFLERGTLPAMVTTLTHLPDQWKEEIELFTDLKIHVVKTRKAYSLPPADVYITNYAKLSGWVNIFEKGIFKSSVFDEPQELRRTESDKYKSAKVLADNSAYCLGLTATPVYNYGDEIFNIMNVIKDGCLGNESDFLREWTGYSRVVDDPKALGAYLREQCLFLRRTRKEVGKELPPVNTIVHTVEYDQAEVEKAEDIARKLAIKVVSGSFVERGQASRDLDMFVRHYTGVAKAKGVAEYVKILLDNGEPIILAGWHRDVYDIWLEELSNYNPVMYTGSESPAQKKKSEQAFINGETNLFIISLRSGVGLDGLQERCSTVIIGELDWSPEVHHQLISRANRDKESGEPNNVTAIYLVSNCGSDPLIIDMLGLKASQSHGILNPFASSIQEQYTDESRIKKLAQTYLDKKQKTTSSIAANDESKDYGYEFEQKG